MTQAIDTQNGHARGRAVPPEKLEAFVFEGTGRVVHIRKVSALIREEARRAVRRDPAFREPDPPFVEVDYGNGKQTIPNKHDPIYLQLMVDWSDRVTTEAGDRIKRLAVKRGVVCEIDQVAVAAVRADLAEEGIDTSDQSDLWVYVAYVCIGPYDDWTDLLRAIFERSAPTEEAVQAHIAAFPGDVREQGPVSSEPRPAAGEAPLHGGV